MVALDSLPPHRRASKENRGKIILIGGGADKNLEYNEYAKVVKEYIKALILFRGLATDKIVQALGKTKFPIEIVDSMKKAMEIARANAKKATSFCFLPAPPVSEFSKTSMIEENSLINLSTVYSCSLLVFYEIA